jgi:hypothetical protein
MVKKYLKLYLFDRLGSAGHVLIGSGKIAPRLDVNHTQILWMPNEDWPSARPAL